MDYRLTAIEILKNVGGVENISHLEHCSTRLRFSVIEKRKVNKEELKDIPGVLGVVMTAQCQVIIGNDVIEVYDELRNLCSFENGDKVESSEKQSIGATILDFIVGVFQPLVPAIAGAGVLKSILVLLTTLGWMSSETGTYQILLSISDAAFYFLPLMVATTTATKLKSNRLVALTAVGVLLFPTIIASLEEGITLFGFQVQNIAYSSQVFPAILCVLFLSLVEKFFEKVSPKAIRIFFVPMMSLLIVIPVTLLILGPLGFYAGQAFTTVILFMYDKLGWIATSILAALLPFMIATGMHKAMVPYAVSTMTELGHEPLYLPASLAHNISEGGACMAVALRSKDSNLKATAFSAGISALFGITEPALYGVTIQNKRVLYGVMLGGLVGGAYVGLTGVLSFVTVGPGLASMSMFVSESDSKNIIHAIIGLVLSFVVSFVAVLLLWQEKATEENQNKTAKEDINTEEKHSYLNETVTFTNVAEGIVVDLTEVKDDVFSGKFMGDGIAVIPEKGELYSPVDGKIEMVFDSKHAIGIKAENGAEILLHVGIDTIQLKGEHFEPLVKAGDRVKAGNLLMKFQLENIKDLNFDPIIPIVITNSDKIIITDKQFGQKKITDEIMKVSVK